jgi:hypothetical protein
MKQPVRNVKLEEIKSKWHENLITDWQPDKEYVEFLKKKIANNDYLAPIVVVQEGKYFYIVNGHHRYYAHLAAGKKKIKCILIEGTFAESEPLRKAEVLLKEFDQKTGYRYRFSGYLDRWAAAVEEHNFINKYRPTYKFRLYKFLKKILADKS